MTIAERAYETCQTKATSLETENYNQQVEIQRLQLESNTLKQQQQLQSQSLGGNNPPAAGQQNFRDIDILNDQKQKTLAGLKEKLRNGQVLSEQEQQVLQMLTKEDYSIPQLPPGKKLPNNRIKSPVVPGNREVVEEAQVVDLVGEKDKKTVNLDGKEDGDFEGGADGGDEDEQDPHGQDYAQLKRDVNNFNEGGNDDFNDHADERDENFNNQEDNFNQRLEDGGGPLPNPVDQVPVANLPNGDTDIMDDVRCMYYCTNLVCTCSYTVPCLQQEPLFYSIPYSG